GVITSRRMHFRGLGQAGSCADLFGQIHTPVIETARPVRPTDFDAINIDSDDAQRVLVIIRPQLVVSRSIHRYALQTWSTRFHNLRVCAVNADEALYSHV